MWRSFFNDFSGHDFSHMERVAKIEGSDSFICEAAGWLHDVQELILKCDLFIK